MEYFDGLQRARHVGSLSDRFYSVVDELLRVLVVELVLGGAWVCEVSFYTPWGFLSLVGNTFELIGVLADTSPLDVLELEDERKLFLVDACGVVDVAIGVAHSHWLRV